MTVIVSIFVWGLLIGGLLGPILAVPLTATLKVLLARYVWGRRLRERVEEQIEEVPSCRKPRTTKRSPSGHVGRGLTSQPELHTPRPARIGSPGKWQSRSDVFDANGTGIAQIPVLKPDGPRSTAAPLILAFALGFSLSHLRAPRLQQLARIAPAQSRLRLAGKTATR